MANTLGSMVLELGADYARFEQGLNRAAYVAQQSAERMQKTMQSAIDGISTSLGNIAGSLVAAFSVDHLVEFGKRAIDAADEVGKMAQKVGVSVEALSALQLQAKLSNVANEELQTGLSKLAKTAADAAGGGKQQAAVFAAMGVSLKDAAGNLRPMDELLGDVAGKFATYKDSAAKTALAQEVFGKSGAQLIPYLNDLGQKSLPEVIEQANEFGAVISTKASKYAEDFNDNITRLSVEAGGFANAVVAKVLPSLVSLSGQMVEAGKTTDGYSSAAEGAAKAVKGFIFGLIVAKEIVSVLATGVFAAYDAISTVFNASGQIVAAWAETTAKAVKAAFRMDPAGLAAADAEFATRLKKITADVLVALQGAAAGLHGGVQQATDNAREAYDALFNSTTEAGKAAEETGKKFGNANAPLVTNAAASDAAAKAQKQLTQDVAKAGEMMTQLLGKTDPVNAAYQQYALTIIKISTLYNKYVDDAKAAGNSDQALADAKKFLTSATNAAKGALDAQLTSLDRQRDVVGRVTEKYNEEMESIGLSGIALSEATVIRDGARIAIENYKNSNRDLPELSDKETAALKNLGDRLYYQKAAADAAAEAARGWQQIWSQAGNAVADTFAKILVEGGSLFNGLKDLAKQTVEQIIAYFAKLSVINPILNGIFGGSVGFSLLPSLANAGGIGGGGSSGSAGAIGGIFSPSSWISAGQNLASGFSSLWGGTSVGGSNFLGSGVGQNFMGPLAPGQNYGFTPSMLGNAISIGGGLLAAYGEFKQAGGGFKGTVAGAAYGLGTITAAGAIGGIATGAGAAAGAAGSLGAVGLGAIPVVGWVALAAMLIDKFSGGKLFGTGANQFQGGAQTQTISDSGAFVDTTGSFKGQKALFGGSYWKTKNIDTDPAVIQAADAFFVQLKDSANAFAKQFGIDTANVVGGSFTQQFDAKGNPTTSSSTVLGVTRQGETQQQFAERLQADTYLAVLDKMGLGASKFVDAMQDNADQLLAAVQDFASATQLANTDLGNGFQFLALKSNSTLVDVMKFVEGLQQSGETLTQAYTRLAQAQTQYNQFVSQFAPAQTFVDPFEAAMSQVYHQMLQNTTAANQLAIAAGAAGASQEDLTNIQNYAAQQMAALVMQLEDSAQSLAFSLGLTDIGSLDQTNQAISDIISAAQGTTEATNSVATGLTITAGALAGFGNAVTSVSKQAADAISLLLGNLSVLNDQQKLQLALQQLRAGTGGVTKDQVLQIGQALYASSEAYVQLFNQVMAIPDRSASSVGGKAGRGGGGKSNAGASNVPPPTDWTDTTSQWASTGLTLAQWNSMSDDNKKKLEDLLNKQDTLKSAQTTQQFQTLAQQIAEIATAKGEDFQNVIDQMGISDAALEKGLGLKSDAELNAYLKNLAAQQDSANENTKSIVDAINALPKGITDALQGKPVGASAVPFAAPARPAPAPAPAPPAGSSGGGGTGRGVAPPPGTPTLSVADIQAIADAFGSSIGRQVAPIVAQGRNNLRQPALTR